MFYLWCWRVCFDNPRPPLGSARTIDYNLITYNMIMALGHVAVALKDTPDTSYSILQFFVQIFCRRPSEVDVLIVDQMGCMVLARSEVGDAPTLCGGAGWRGGRVCRSPLQVGGRRYVVMAVVFSSGGQSLSLASDSC